MGTMSDEQIGPRVALRAVEVYGTKGSNLKWSKIQTKCARTRPTACAQSLSRPAFHFAMRQGSQPPYICHAGEISRMSPHSPEPFLESISPILTFYAQLSLTGGRTWIGGGESGRNSPLLRLGTGFFFGRGGHVTRARIL